MNTCESLLNFSIIFCRCGSEVEPSMRRYEKWCMFKNVSKMSSMRDICVNSRQRWPSRRRRGSSSLSTCSLPQSYCSRRFSGNCTARSVCQRWMAGLRVRRGDETHSVEYASIASARGAGTGAAPVEGAMGCIGFARGVSTVKCSTNHACCAQKAENDGAAVVSACVNPSHARVASATASVGAWYTRSRRAPSQPICGATNATVLRRARRTARSCCVSTTSSTSPRRSVRTTCCVPADHTSASERNCQHILATSAQQR